MKIGFLSIHNPHDRRSFSGTAHFMARALSGAPGVTLRVVGGHQPNRLLRRLARRVGWPRPRAIEARDLEGLDWIVCLASTKLVVQAADAGVARVAHVTDATPGFIRSFYGDLVTPAKEADEARALEAADRVIYSSHFMAEQAAREFGAHLAPKIAAVPFGANFDDLPDAPPAKPPLAPVRLLIVTRDWKRKGGAVALAALDALAARGIDARLSVVGCDPPGVRERGDVDVVGFLDKNVAADYRRLRQVFASSHLFLLPTEADCTPMVVAEANAHALPVLITETGGIPSLMDPGRNGAMLPPGADGAAYAGRIAEMVADPATYAALARSSFEHYRARLNWSAWARDVTALLRGRDDGGDPA